LTPGGRGPSLSNTPNISTGLWCDIFGPVLSIYFGHGYSTWDRLVPTVRVLPTNDILRGRTSIRVYFCANWCGPCTAFTPILKKYYTAQRAARALNEDGALEIILVSRCRTTQDTEDLFYSMPWTAMPHADAVGTRGDDLMTRFKVSTIPALVLLDGTGTIICQDGRSAVMHQQAAALTTTSVSSKVRALAATTTAPKTSPDVRPPAAARTASGITAQAGSASIPDTRRYGGPRQLARPPSPRLPVQDCDLPAAARRPLVDAALPPDPRLARHRSPRPPGTPPTFPFSPAAPAQASGTRPTQQRTHSLPASATQVKQDGANAPRAICPGASPPATYHRKTATALTQFREQGGRAQTTKGHLCWHFVTGLSGDPTANPTYTPNNLQPHSCSTGIVGGSGDDCVHHPSHRFRYQGGSTPGAAQWPRHNIGVQAPKIGDSDGSKPR
jgi:hypothetical protein